MILDISHACEFVSGLQADEREELSRTPIIIKKNHAIDRHHVRLSGYPSPSRERLAAAARSEQQSAARQLIAGQLKVVPLKPRFAAPSIVR